MSRLKYSRTTCSTVSLVPGIELPYRPREHLTNAVVREPLSFRSLPSGVFHLLGPFVPRHFSLTSDLVFASAHLSSL
jgi:hypothetical protein